MRAAHMLRVRLRRGGAFVFDFNISTGYPHDAPKVKCMTKVSWTFTRLQMLGARSRKFRSRLALLIGCGSRCALIVTQHRSTKLTQPNPCAAPR